MTARNNSNRPEHKYFDIDFQLSIMYYPLKSIFFMSYTIVQFNGINYKHETDLFLKVWKLQNPKMVTVKQNTWSCSRKISLSLRLNWNSKEQLQISFYSNNTVKFCQVEHAIQVYWWYAPLDEQIWGHLVTNCTNWLNRNNTFSSFGWTRMHGNSYMYCRINVQLKGLFFSHDK